MPQRSIAITLLVLCTGALVVGATVLLVRQSTPPPILIEGPGTGIDVSPPPDQVRVHLAGAIRRPGVYQLPLGARLVDALEQAGGATDKADLAAVNLAQPLEDANRYYVPFIVDAVVFNPDTPIANSGQPTGGFTEPSARINLNTAPLDALDSLPGIGTARAQEIIDYRDRNGPFASIDELMEVPGIGPVIFAGLLDLITVGP